MKPNWCSSIKRFSSRVGFNCFNKLFSNCVQRTEKRLTGRQDVVSSIFSTLQGYNDYGELPLEGIVRRFQCRLKDLSVFNNFCVNFSELYW